jgi:hypothetical protein
MDLAEDELEDLVARAILYIADQVKTSFEQLEKVPSERDARLLRALMLPEAIEMSVRVALS